MMRKPFISQALALSVLLSGVLSAPVLAQSDPAFPAGINNPGAQANPGLQVQPDELALPESQRKEQQKLIQKDEEVVDIKIDVPEPPPVTQAPSPKFVVHEITVTGVTVFDMSDINAIVDPYRHRANAG